MTQLRDSATADEHVAAASLFQIAFGYIPAQMIHVAARLRIPDLLGPGERDAAELAERTGTHEPSLRRLLRGLAGFGILSEPAPGRFALAPAGTPLRADVPNSIRPILMAYFDEVIWRSWGNLLHTVRTGQPAFEHTVGTSIFDHFARNPALSPTFNDAMAVGTRAEAPQLVEACDFGRFRTLVDVGGGNGSLVGAALAANPGLQGVVFDSESGTRQTPAVLEALGVADRCRVSSGDFLESVPAGGDAYVLKSILHDWDDERCVTILRNCRRVLPAGGRVFAIELLLPAAVDAGTAPFALVSDINLLVTTPGGERTEDGFRELFGAAGLELVRIGEPLGLTGHRVLEATPV
jgi:hypothetical protein